MCFKQTMVQKVGLYTKGQKFNTKNETSTTDKHN
jgi:hypothetical protein